MPHHHQPSITRPLPILCVAFALLSPSLRAETIRVEVNRDAWVSQMKNETMGNNGGAPKVKLKSAQEFTLLDIDPTPLKGRIIQRAQLHIMTTTPDWPMRRSTVSTIATPWTEGTGVDYAEQAGSISFLWARNGEKPWAWPGSDITAVTNGMGNTIWRFADPTAPDARGWQTLEVEPAVLAANVAGVAHGMLLFDDVGSEYERQGDKGFLAHPFPNRFFASREAGRGQGPYFTIELGGQDDAPPKAVTSITSVTAVPASLPPGEAMVTWDTPADVGSAGTIGFFVRYAEGEQFDWDKAAEVPRYLIPMSNGKGPSPRSRPLPAPVTMHLRDLGLKGGTTITLGVRAVDAAGNVGPVTTGKIELSNAPATIALQPAPVKAFDKPAPLPVVGGVEVSIVDTLDKLNPSSGEMIPPRQPEYRQANHLWSAADKTIRLHAARNEFVDFQVLLSGQTTGISASLTFDKTRSPLAPRPRLFRFRHVKAGEAMLPDPVLPLGEKLAIPAEDEQIAEQKHAAILAEVYIPHDAKPGKHLGALTLSVGEEMLTLNVELTVWNFTLPDYLSFIPEMNCYSLPANEIDYYRVGHEHRTVVNRLPYGWSGATSTPPKWNGKDFEWAEYDKRFGPMLDGSAFNDLPRKGVPLEKFYLPFNENWPIDIHKHFKGGYWADECFDPAYRAQMVDAFGKFAAHADERKWHGTIFEYYLNNKVGYKEGNKTRPADWYRSSALWLLDEPYHTQDFWALRWYGIAFHEGVADTRGNARFIYRCDISRPQWQRDMLDGVIDVNCVGGPFRAYQRYVMDRARRNGEFAQNYGSSNPVETSNIQPAAWCLDTWTLGGRGVLPWQTIGKADAWTKADQLALFYPGDAIGQPGVFPSVRLKSYRRGQQDVEYLTLLTHATSAPQFAVAQAARDALKLVAKVEKKSAEDAGLVGYGDINPEALWELRLRVGAALDAAAPAPKRKLVEFVPVKRDVTKLPPMGYVTKRDE